MAEVAGLSQAVQPDQFSNALQQSTIFMMILLAWLGNTDLRASEARDPAERCLAAPAAA